MSQDIKIMCDAFGGLFLTPLIFETVNALTVKLIRKNLSNLILAVKQNVLL
jgi:hypothetical protein